MVCEVWGNPHAWKAPSTGGANRSEVSQAKVCNSHAAPPGRCEHFDRRGRAIGDQQDDGGSPIPNVVAVLRGKSGGKIVEGLRRFVEIGNKDGGGGGHVGKRHEKFQHL